LTTIIRGCRRSSKIQEQSPINEYGVWPFLNFEFRTLNFSFRDRGQANYFQRLRFQTIPHRKHQKKRETGYETSRNLWWFQSTFPLVRRRDWPDSRKENPARQRRTCVRFFDCQRASRPRSQRCRGIRGERATLP